MDPRLRVHTWRKVAEKRSPSGIWSSSVRTLYPQVVKNKAKSCHSANASDLNPSAVFTVQKKGHQIGLGELHLPQAPFAGANATAGRVGGGGWGEPISRGGWLSFALIWTQAGGVCGELLEGKGEKEKQAQHHHNGRLASHCRISDALYPPFLRSTSHASTGFNCSGLLTSSSHSAH